ncbi:hypothetical protein ACP3VW_05890 [Vibrio sp. DNB22_17_1]
MKVVILIFSLFLTACASMNDALTPSVKVETDPFDNSVHVYQSPVSASSSMSEAWHTMGFDWKSSQPNTVYVTAGLNSIVNISNIEFNADGKFFKDVQQASAHTEYGDWSTRRFKMTLHDFEELSNANDVRFKIETLNTYSVSSFGKSNTNALVNAKFKPFLTAIYDAKAKK